MSSRQYVLGGVLLCIAALAAVILVDVLGTVFFALTVAYLLVPLRRRLRQRGLSRLWSTVAVTAAAVASVLALFGPVVYLLIGRFGEVRAFIDELPESVVIEAFGFSYDLLVADLNALVREELTALAAEVAAALPVLLIKLGLFVLLVFSLVHNQRDIRAAAIAVVPPGYRDIADALHTRARETLFALYVLQAATAIGTFLIALPVFVVFGYDSPVILATVAGVLQFVPIVGPSFLLVVLVAGHLLVGDVASALAIGLVGGFLIAWLPDLLIRPQLASRTGDISGSLYFIGFVGGLLSLGAIGIIVGPLVVALLTEAAGLLAVEFDADLTGEDDEEFDVTDTDPSAGERADDGLSDATQPETE
ncbi:MAG: AI-2E family transporter [Halohasta sp.]